MTARNPTKVFLQAVLLVAAIGGAVVGLIVGLDATGHKWQVEGLTVPEVAYMASAAGALLIIAGCLVARTNAKKIPILSMITGFVILGIAFNGLTHDFTGRMGDIFLWVSGCSFGVAIGLVLAHRMTRSAQQRREDR
ncbi:MAG: hypothetical protein KGI68_01360 [Alphaproteobacteria bacterium]|nr:hypothetical protein [Alphaproteobacteria bacterium]MDE1986045.1 hypothetical protein [Alphaproteobacteria bacterium]MDE2164058.1 hypothetical protein [Alphaproteobacteria bacterium]MDE2266842.1 hypothetical protein [Alphaproteobacteria bacterium]MDE2500111.1 hypothetical protein [Alphaproteobacteria bacterium]